MVAMRGCRLRRAAQCSLWGLLLLSAACSDDDATERSPSAEGSPVTERGADGPQEVAPGTSASTESSDVEQSGDPASPTGMAAPELDRDMEEALEALGYVPRMATSNPEDRGVTVRTGDVAPGVNLYSTRKLASAVLMDSAGRVLHEWKVDTEHEEKPEVSWMHIEPLPSGALYVIAADHYLAKYDWDSKIVWRQPLRAHHDLAIHDDGRLFVLTRDRHTMRYAGETLPVLADAITIVKPDGTPERTVELLPLFEEHVSEARLTRLRRKIREGERTSRLVRDGGVGDVLHTNSISFLSRDIPSIAPAGAVLLSFRALSQIAILSPSLDRVLWMWGDGILDRQHDATQLDGGHILLFDNGFARQQSRALELDPATGRIVWTHAPEGLFSRLRGGAQKLPNGHVLITESDAGHALEVTTGGEVVWEFWNPDVEGGGDDADRAVIYRLNRFPRALFSPLGR